MGEPESITPKEDCKKSNDGTALLGCAYDDEGRFRAIHLLKRI
jgi:hypothetical protein